MVRVLRRPVRHLSADRRAQLGASASNTSLIGGLFAAPLLGRSAGAALFGRLADTLRRKRAAVLAMRGGRQLNYALPVMAMAQIKGATPGRDYYQRKRAAGKTTKKPCVVSSDASSTSSTAP